MDEKEILQRQVDALEKLLQIKEAIIQEQEAKISKLEMDSHFMPPPPQQPVFIPTVFQHDPCPLDGGHHEYHNPWFSTSPQPCKKCGRTLPQGWTITSQNDAKLGDV